MTSLSRNLAPVVAGNDQTSEDLLQALRFLLVRYARGPSPTVAGKVAGCLDMLLAHPGFRPPPDERCTYRRMRTYWRLVERLG